MCFAVQNTGVCRHSPYRPAPPPRCLLGCSHLLQMGFELSVERIAAENDWPTGVSPGGLRPSRAAACPPQRRHRSVDRSGGDLPCRSAVVGRRYRRHPVCALPGTGRAAQCHREARRLRSRLQARALDPGDRRGAQVEVGLVLPLDGSDGRTPASLRSTLSPPCE